MYIDKYFFYALPFAAFFRRLNTAYDSTPDLNMGETISVSAPTQGVQGYWCARVRYRENSGEFKEGVTSVCLYDGDANFIEKY